MELYVLDSEFKKQAYVEGTDSIIYSLRYADAGDFEIHVIYSAFIVSYLQKGAYIFEKKSRTAMFIEDIEYETDSEGGPIAVFKGRSLESMLNRRIIWNKKVVSGKIQDIIFDLLKDNVITPQDPDRKIPNFVFKESSDSRLKDYTIDKNSPMELYGDNLYDTIKSLCDLYDVGFRITLSEDNKFIFELYCGEMLNGSIQKNRRVVFSPKMENLSNTRYYLSTQNEKTVTKIDSTYDFKAEQANEKDDASATTRVIAKTASWVVAPRSASELTQFVGKKIGIRFNKKLGSNAMLSLNGTAYKPLYYKNAPLAAEVIDSGTEMVMQYASTGGGRWNLIDIKEDDPPIQQNRVLVEATRSNPPLAGLERKEIFTDANSITTEEGMTPDDYAYSMRIMGINTLHENRIEQQIDGESIPDINYIFGEDYSIGDIVLVENEIGLSMSSRVIEYVQSIDENGPSACPTFSSVYY